MTTFNKTQITIGSQTVDVFQNESGEYLYSLTAAANLLQKEALSAFQYINSQSFKAKQGIGFTPFQYPKDGGGYYSLVPSWVIIKYLAHHATKNGNELAGELLEALATESLDVRSMRAFDQLTADNFDSRIAKTNERLLEWSEARQFSKKIHGNFSTAAKHKKHPAHLVHDYITAKINGLTAKQARQGQLVTDELDPTIGLNYVDDTTRLQTIALAKLEYCGLRAGDWVEQAERAVNTVLRDIRQEFGNII